MSFSTEDEVDEEKQWNEQRSHECLMVLCGVFGTSIEALKEVGEFERALEEVRAVGRHGWVGGNRYAHIARTIPSPSSASSQRFPAVEVPEPSRRKR